MDEITLKNNIAFHLKSIRKKSGLSLDAVAKKTGVSKAMLGQIERGESSPSIAKLWQIASGLECSFSSFLGDEIFTDGISLSDVDEDMKVRTLSPFQADTHIEILEVTLFNQHQQVSKAHAKGVIEYITVISGTLECFYDDCWHTLVAGETVRFNAHQDHIYRCDGVMTRFHNTIYYP